MRLRGTGKTAVLVERFVRAVVDDGLDVDSLLVITYTERAAGELRARIRSELIAQAGPTSRSSSTAAWVSTIHGFCRRLLGAYPPWRASTLPASPTSRRRSSCRRRRAFDGARTVLRRTRPSAGSSSRPTARPTAQDARRGLRDAPVGGSRAGTEPGTRASLEPCVSALRDAASSLLADAGATDAQHDAASAALELLEASTPPGAAARARRPEAARPRAATFVEARDRVVAAALEDLAAHDRELLQELLTAFAAAYGEAKARESALDFEDLQLRTRDLVARPRGRLRARTGPFRLDHGRRVPGHEPPPDRDPRPPDGRRRRRPLFVVGDEFQSIYGFRLPTPTWRCSGSVAMA